MRFSIKQKNEENDILTTLQDILKRMTRMESKMHEFFDDNYQDEKTDNSFPHAYMNVKDEERLDKILDVFDTGFWTVQHAVKLADCDNPKSVHNLILHARNTEGYEVEDKVMVGNNCKMYRIRRTSHAAA